MGKKRERPFLCRLFSVMWRFLLELCFPMLSFDYVQVDFNYI